MAHAGPREVFPAIVGTSLLDDSVVRRLPNMAARPLGTDSSGMPSKLPKSERRCASPLPRCASPLPRCERSTKGLNVSPSVAARALATEASLALAPTRGVETAGERGSLGTSPLVAKVTDGAASEGGPSGESKLADSSALKDQSVPSSNDARAAGSALSSAGGQSSTANSSSLVPVNGSSNATRGARGIGGMNTPADSAPGRTDSEPGRRERGMPSSGSA